MIAFRGSVVATGFAIDTALVGIDEARGRVLALWQPGAVVYEHASLLVVAGLPAARVRVARAPGAPLVPQHGAFATVPVSERELAIGAIAVARGGRVEVIASDPIAIASWIDLDELEIAQTEPLASVPLRVPPPPPPTRDVRVLVGMPASDPAAIDAGTALVRGGAPGTRRPGLGRRLARWFARLLSRGGERALPAPGERGTAKRSWLRRLRDRIARAAWTSRLGSVLGRRHAEYLAKMLELFERGELDEALRHAIPLGGKGGGDSLALAPPAPREKLELSFGARASASSAIPLADQTIALVRERYRAAAKRLEEQGRIDEAAFVYAELLDDVRGAIALLERHARFELAAKLAEGHRLEPGFVVRLWFLAGDRTRAIDIARRERAWADAIARLERDRDPRADVLRMLWADHLADAGDFVRAVDVAWPSKPSHALLESWIDRGLAAEGTVAARMCIKKLVIAPRAYDQVMPQVLALLDADDSAPRVELAHELLAAPPSKQLRTLARPIARAIVRDGAAGLARDVVTYAQDAALRADLPAVPAAARAELRADARWAASDAGTVPVFDAAALPGDRLLVALGELGVHLLGRDGRVLARIDQPADRLVVSDVGTRALACSMRGEVMRIARLDLVQRRGAHWCDAPCGGGADSFDGDLWVATHGNEVLAVDTLAARWRVVWGVDIDGEVVGLAVHRDREKLAIDAICLDGIERWSYEGFTLRARTRRPLERYTAFAGEYSASEHGGVVTAFHRDRCIAALHLDGAARIAIRIAFDRLTVCDDRGRVIVLDLRSGALRTQRVTI